MKILLADDEKINLLSASKLLENRGHTVVTAVNGLQVLNLLKDQAFDCIVLDIEMPILNGLETAKQIQDSSVFGDKSKTPIIAMTGHSFKDSKEDFEKAGIKHYVSKPFDIEDLVQTIEKSTSSNLYRKSI
ncbi:response regulator [Desulfovibrio gilichinskyi]|uniref:Response regulator receiver domain-containing protein n=1 Tax=Desulfovibrio gilichinskyi TaxID=1519643 RepID=A0A1X7CN77_9BACT|nr:response regulator [Desulfovibrio gilichinskyi]SME99872.1 Response regulator receiver domain-containing protein [Desulfovibrio gilichinskyi]